MKTYFSIFILAVIFIAAGCGKPEKTAEQIAAETAAKEDSIRNVAAQEVADRKAKLKEARDAKTAQRTAAWEEKAKTSPTFKDKSGKTVYYKGEVDPKYAGGEEAMTKYLQDNLKYPEDAKTKGIEGTVYVDFIVDKKGAVREVAATDFTLEQVDSTLVNEAVRVVSTMPAWVAGTKGGKPVDLAYSIPITFELQD